MVMYQASVAPLGAATDHLFHAPKNWFKPPPADRQEDRPKLPAQTELMVPVDPTLGSRLDIQV